MPRANSADKILGCATQMFAKNGYAGTIMDELAEACELNKATIYYHYKDKSNLYEEVLTRHLTVVVDTVTDAVAKQENALGKIDAYVKAFSQANSQNSFIVSILMREIASGSELMPDRAKAQMHRMLMIIKQIIEQGVKEENFLQVDPLMIHFMVLGSLSFFIASEPMRKKMQSTDKKLQKSFQSSTLEDVTKQLSQMLKNALLQTKE